MTGRFAEALRRRAPVPAGAAVLLMFGLRVTEVVRGPVTGTDNAIVVRAARALLAGRSPYEDQRFLYLPGAVFAAVPQVPFSDRVLHYAVPLGVALLILLGWWLSLRIFQVPVTSRLFVAGVAGLTFFLPTRSLVYLGNWTVLSVVALPGALLLARRGRWCAAGAVIGAAIATKPLLVPVLLLFLFTRRWRALAIACGLPLAVAVLGALVMPRPGLFLTKTVPFLLHGQDAYARPFDASLMTILPRLGIPLAGAAVPALVLAAATVALAWRRWRAAGDEGLRLVETAALLMLAAFLVSRPAFLHYLPVVVLPLAASLPAEGAVSRTPWFFIALLPELTGLYWPELEAWNHRAFKDAACIVGLTAVLAWHALRTRPPLAGAPPTATEDTRDTEEGAAHVN